MKTNTAYFLSISAVCGTLVMVGCGKKSDVEQPTTPGVAERAGAELDMAAQKTVDVATNVAAKTAEAAKSAAVKTKDVAGQAVEKTGEALEKAGDAVEKTGTDMQK